MDEIKQLYNLLETGFSVTELARLFTIKLLRNLLALGFSVTELARLFTVSSQAISQWLSGVNRPSEAHTLDLLDLHALASEHLTHGGDLADFTTGGQWRPRAMASPRGGAPRPGAITLETARSEQLMQAIMPDKALSLHEAGIIHATLTLEQAADDISRLAAAIQLDPLQTIPAQTLHDLCNAVLMLQETILALYWDRVRREPVPSTAPQKGGKIVTQGP